MKEVKTLTLTSFHSLHLFIVLPDEGDGSNLESCNIAGLVKDMEIVVRWHSVDRPLTTQLCFWRSPVEILCKQKFKQHRG